MNHLYIKVFVLYNRQVNALLLLQDKRLVISNKPYVIPAILLSFNAHIQNTVVKF
jgi:hypothetical protein